MYRSTAFVALLLVCGAAAIAPGAAITLVIDPVSLPYSQTARTVDIEAYARVSLASEEAPPALWGFDVTLGLSTTGQGVAFVPGSVSLPAVHPYVFPSGGAFTGSVVGGAAYGADFLLDGSAPLANGAGLMRVTVTIAGGATGNVQVNFFDPGENMQLVADTGLLPFDVSPGTISIGNVLTVVGKLDVSVGAPTPQTIPVNVNLIVDPDNPANSGVIHVADQGTTLEIVGTLSNADASIGLTKTGFGALLLSSAVNDYHGNTYVADGVLRIPAGLDGGGTLAGETTVNDDAGSGTAELVTAHVRQEMLTINPGGKVTISASAGAASTSVVNVLNIADGSGAFNWVSGSSGVASTDAGGAMPVPEPATWLLAVIAMLAGVIAWRSGPFRSSL